MVKTLAQRNGIRYRLHAKVKKDGFKINVHSRTIFAPYENPNLTNSIERLQKEYGYVVKLEIT